MKLLVLALGLFTGLCYSQIPNLHTVKNGELYRSARLSKANYREAKKLGIRTVVNFEEEHQQEKGWAQEVGIQYRSIPIGGMDCPTKSQIEKALALIASDANQPVLIHCHYGKDRTGIVSAAYRIRYQNWSVQRAIDELRDMGHYEKLYHCDSILYEFDN